MNFLSAKEFLIETSIKSDDTPMVPKNPPTKYQNSNLSEERISELVQILTTLLQEQKIFTDPNLNLERLAKAVGVPSYQLSQAINVGLRQSFNDLLNTCRINYAKDILKNSDYANETIINVALMSGYNSKSTFNMAFKKLTGLTPSEFRKSSSDNSQKELIN